MNATEANKLGLVDRLIEPERWDEDLDNLMVRMRSLPQPVLHLTKLGVQNASTMDATTMLSFDWEGQQQCWASRETAEGLQAAAEGRSARFDIATADEED
jgi:enoyl-CoA hydratase/carnithine racemase